MFAKKKNTPDAHWINIAKIACKTAKTDFNKTVFVYTKTSIGVFESFISCWDQKFKTNVVRPETYINQCIDENWKPQLQTPPFPEYTSGHSVLSACSAANSKPLFGTLIEKPIAILISTSQKASRILFKSISAPTELFSILNRL